MIDDKILAQFSGKGVLVTGGTGLIGRQVVELLCDAGAKVQIISLDRVVVDARAEHIHGDLTSFDYCKSAVTGQDFVFHLAGIKASAAISESRLASHFIPTLMMNTNVLEACRLAGVKKVVYTSSIGAYANTDIFREEEYRLDTIPMDFAGWAKRMAELQIHAYKVQHGMENFAVVRPCNVYGPGDNFDPDNAMVVPALMGRIHRGENPMVIWGDGSAVRDFAYSRDVAEGVILALHHGTRGTFVNLGNGRGHTIRELVEALCSFLHFEYRFDASKPSGFPIRIMDTARAKEWIGYQPTTSLQEGLQKTWEWFINNQDEHLHKKNYFRDPKNDAR
ncbi:MAG: NAD-dependent epimerase/dehydratase family protein [Magnetococcales bacterium]|nr:NAD-dependent epimerase/dehydratase family protein [Magnetococcales bacterium]